MLRGSSDTPEEHPTRVAEDQKMLFFHWFYSDFNAEQNGGPTEKQRRDTPDIAAPRLPREAFLLVFLLFSYSDYSDL